MLALCGLVMPAQENGHNFKAVDHAAIWQRVMESPLDSASIATAVLKSPNFSDVRFVDGILMARILPRAVDYKKAGFARTSIALYLVSSLYSCSVRIDFRPGRYRVTAEGIVFTANETNGLFRQGEVTTLESYAVNKKGELRPIFLSSAAEVLDADLSGLFDFHQEPEEDW